MIDFVFKNWTRQKTPAEKFFNKILEVAAKELKLKDDFSISVNIVSESKINTLNKKYRKKNKPTDVLSFPLNNQQPITNNQRQITRLPNCPITDIGDIFVCLSIAKNDAKSENISINRKLAQLTVHGFLHLQGYEHEKSKKEAEKMFKLERKILSKIRCF
ncbi:MAG: rRNA maturation RNase YbeY [Candidatus Yanofskybacteria bacterium]|nr:rRNA maturation RNase YbeY [Candidatus Yanofskybacteria bacterium]